MSSYDFHSTCLRLRPDSSIELIPADGFWPRLISGQLGSFHHEYLVTTAEYTEAWPAWEIHPNGDEIVCLICGHVTLVQEKDGVTSRSELRKPGDFALNPRGTWHTTDVHAPSVMLFITAGEGTMNRPRT